MRRTYFELMVFCLILWAAQVSYTDGHLVLAVAYILFDVVGIFVIRSNMKERHIFLW